MLVSKPELCSSKTKKKKCCQQLKGLSPILHAGTRALQLAACPPWGAGGQGGGTPGCPRGGCRVGAGLGGRWEPAHAARSALPSPPGSPLLAVSALCEPGGCDLKSVSAGRAGEKGLLFGWGSAEPRAPGGEKGSWGLAPRVRAGLQPCLQLLLPELLSACFHHLQPRSTFSTGLSRVLAMQEAPPGLHGAAWEVPAARSKAASGSRSWPPLHLLHPLAASREQAGHERPAALLGCL